jgi:hypothetical protein
MNAERAVTCDAFGRRLTPEETWTMDPRYALGAACRRGRNCGGLPDD